MSSPDQQAPGPSHPGGEGAVSLITREVLEAYLNCKLKGHLKLAGQTGTPSDYEVLMKEVRAETLKRSEVKLAARYGGEPLRGVRIDLTCLKRGVPLILDGVIEDDGLSLRVDGLIRIDEPSRLGDFQYAPVLIHEREKIEPEQRRLLALLGQLIGDMQGKQPTYGFIVRGRSLKMGKIEFNVRSRSARRLLDEIRGLLSATSQPRLILNDHCQVCEFRRACEQQAISEDNLSLLRGLGEKAVKGYGRRGIFTITQLAHTFRPRRKRKSPERISTHRYHALSALAIRDHAVYIIARPPAFPIGTRAYLDVESDPDEGYVYLIGLIVVQGDQEHRFSFWADAKDEECRIFDLLLDELERLGEFTLFCYGSFEKTFLKRMRKRMTRTALVDRVISSLVNVLSVIYTHFYFCTYSNGLKDIGRLIGFEWTENASAIQSIVWHLRWQRSGDVRWKEKILIYNIEDCLALIRVAHFIEDVAAGVTAIRTSSGSEAGSAKVTLVEDIDRARATRAWGLNKFALPDFEFISQCSYFDYQREHVYVRMSPILKARRAVRKPGRTNKRLRVNQNYAIVRTTCPHCSGTDLKIDSRKLPGAMKAGLKRAYDLLVTPSGVRRRVILCRASRHLCRSCGAMFMPDTYRNLDKHFHNLKCVTMYLHIARRLSFSHLEGLLLDLFGLNVCGHEIMMFRTLLARKYEGTYEAILKKILAGTLVHIDETEIKLRGESGYVWVLTSVDEVYYMYRPNREGGFLQELFKEFRGVIVSDFYGAYDALPCQQQKCLIHLMRDMNQLLLNNPFDEDLQSITRPFGTLLRSIITTVDKHCLKRKHLEEYERGIAEFAEALARQSLCSEAAESLRERLLKCWGKLFTFIHHDGVSWNNNYAENAIRTFAYYRENIERAMTAEGLREHLVLLSLFQTCRYREINFLKFLLSREVDLLGFRDRKRLKVIRPILETYPDGFVPPHFAKLHEWQRGLAVDGQEGEECPPETGEPDPL